MTYRTLRRPIGGWAFRAWCREVLGWLQLAFVFLCFWGTGNVLVAMIDMAMK